MPQDLKNLIEVRVTLKSGVQATILLPKDKDVPKLFSKLHLIGYEARPLMVKKTLVVPGDEIAMVEIFDTPHIVWGDAINGPE